MLSVAWSEGQPARERVAVAETLTSHVEWSTLSLANQPTLPGHIESRFSTSKGVWTAPVLVEDPNIAVHGLSPALNYGQQCYEGLKAFRAPGDKSIHVFRPHLHAARLARSAECVCMPAPDEAHFLNCLRLAVAANAAFIPPAETRGFMYIRPVLFGVGPSLALAPPDEFMLAVFVAPVAVPYHGGQALDALILEDFDRAAPRGTGTAKVGGNYAPVWRHAAKAKQLGYPMTLHLDSQTRTLVEEFSTSGFLGVRVEGPDKVLVVPETSTAIASVTSDSFQTLATRAGWAVEKRQLPYGELSRLAEVFAVGTAAAALPIRSISRLSTGEKFEFPGTSGKEGAQSEGLALAKRLMDIQAGRADDLDAWRFEVTVASERELELLQGHGGAPEELLPQSTMPVSLSALGSVWQRLMLLPRHCMRALFQTRV